MSRPLPHIAVAFALALAAAPVAAESILPDGFSLSATIANDYVFRGISQTQADMALQAAGEYSHAASGLYAGLFLSNVDFRDGGGQRRAYSELDVLVGARGEVGKLGWDIGGVYYAYLGSPTSFNYPYLELVGKLSYDLSPVKLLTMVAVSPNFQAASGLGAYVEGGVDIALPFEFTASGRVGYQWIDDNIKNGLPDYLNYSVGLSRELFTNLTLAAGYYGTDIKRARCGSSICQGRGLVSLTYKF